jgi:uncharacterized protein (DUF983 family)
MSQPIYTMPPLAPVLPETRAHRCPSCQSERIAPSGHVTASDGLIKAKHACEACGTPFWFVRKAVI